MTVESVENLFRTGLLDEAIDAAATLVRSAPSDDLARLRFAALLLFRGEWQKSDKQLELLDHPERKSAYAARRLRDFIGSEVTREECHFAGRAPEMPFGPTPGAEAALRALLAIREGDPAEAVRQVAAIEQVRPKLSGVVDGKPFRDFRDADDIVAPVLEVCSPTGKYWWIPWEHVRSLERLPVSEYTDRLWSPVKAVLCDEAGNDIEYDAIFVPRLYVATHRAVDPALRLGRAISWREDPPGVVRGRGLRTFFAGEENVAFVEFQRIEFHGRPTTA